MTYNWTEEARKSEIFHGKRLSEIAKMMVANYVTLTDEQRAHGTRALAYGWLDIVEGAKNHYGQQKIDAA